MNTRTRTYIIYGCDDKSNLPGGFYIVTEQNKEIIRFLKLYISNESGIPEFSLRAFQVDSLDKEDEVDKTIEFNFESNKIFYNIFLAFHQELNGIIKTTIPAEQGENLLYTKYYMDSVSLVIKKNLYGIKFPTKFVDIAIGDNNTCPKYLAVYNLFERLKEICTLTTNEDTIQKILNSTTKKV